MWLVMEFKNGDWRAFNLSRTPVISWFEDSAEKAHLVIRLGDGDWHSYWKDSNDGLRRVYVLNDEAAATLIARRIQQHFGVSPLQQTAREVKRHD